MQTTQIQQFNEYRPRLFAIAYKMTKSIADAEDVLQDTYVSMSRQANALVQNPEAYWVKSVINRCLLLLERKDKLSYPGINLPEPLFEEAYPEMHSQDVGYALLVLLQKLNPVERAVFLLKETFDYSYKEIAEWLVLEEAHCRQLLHRAREKMASPALRFRPEKETQKTLIYTFMEVCANGKVDQLMHFLKEDITIFSDGGGKAFAALHPIPGREKCIQFLMGLVQKRGEQLIAEPMIVNNETGILFFDKSNGNALDTVMLFSFEGSVITDIYFIRNPDKLTRKRYAINEA